MDGSLCAIIALFVAAFVLKAEDKKCYKIEGYVKDIRREKFCNISVAILHLVALDGEEYHFWIERGHAGQARKMEFGEVTYQKKSLRIKKYGEEYKFKFVDFKKAEPLAERKAVLETG
jgi:hypothetical protein